MPNTSIAPEESRSVSCSPSDVPERLRVVILDEELPYPANSGKRIRTLGLVTRLACRHDITYICHRNQEEAEIEPAQNYFAQCGIDTLVLNRAIPAKSGPSFYARLAGNLLSPNPYSVQTHASRELREAIHSQVASGEVDLIQAEWTPYAHRLREVHDVPWIVMAHNVESLIWQRYHEMESSRLKRWYIGRQWKKFQAFEKDVFGRTDRVVAVSRPDAELARTQFEAPRVDVVDNGVDVDYFHPADVEREPNRLLFLGSLDWRPNLDAVTLLLEETFPNILSRTPNSHLDIVGRNPPTWLRQQADAISHVELHANVPDVRPFLWRAGMLVVPLRIGGGSRLKILEALATGCPVLSTRVGAEGLDLIPGEHFCQADTPQDMAGAVAHWINHPEQALACAATGRAQTIQQYSWDVLAKRLDQIWRQVARAGSASPK